MGKRSGVEGFGKGGERGIFRLLIFQVKLVEWFWSTLFGLWGTQKNVAQSGLFTVYTAEAEADYSLFVCLF